MKKLMILAVAACAAVMANAATTNWVVGAVLTDGSTGGGDPDWDNGTYAPAGWSVYLFDANGSVSYATMKTYLEAASTDASNFNTALGSKVDMAKLAEYGEDGAIGIDPIRNVNLTANSGNVSAYLVIVDAAGEKANLVDIASAVIPGSGLDADLTGSNGEGFGPDADGWIDARGYSSTSGNWYSVAAVPEPTSGLLLLLGVAGLALKRKRA